MPLNIIVKNKERVPSWRPGQPKLGSFKSLDRKDSKRVSASHSVEEQFSKEEKQRIDAACHYTNNEFPNLGAKAGNPHTGV